MTIERFYDLNVKKISVTEKKANLRRERLQLNLIIAIEMKDDNGEYLSFCGRFVRLEYEHDDKPDNSEREIDQILLIEEDEMNKIHSLLDVGR